MARTYRNQPPTERQRAHRASRPKRAERRAAVAQSLKEYVS